MLLSIILTVMFVVFSLLVNKVVKETNEVLRGNIQTNAYVSNDVIVGLSYSFIKDCKLRIVRIRDNLRSSKLEYTL